MMILILRFFVGWAPEPPKNIYRVRTNDKTNDKNSKTFYPYNAEIFLYKTWRPKDFFILKSS